MSFDTAEENAAFADKFGFPFVLLCDTMRSVGLAYGACDSPTASHADRISYLIDDQGAVEKVYATVNPRSHPAEVLADLVS